MDRNSKMAMLVPGVVVGVWAATELTWWWRRKVWRARSLVPWRVRRVLYLPPPGGGHGRRGR